MAECLDTDCSRLAGALALGRGLEVPDELCQAGPATPTENGQG